MKHLCTLMLFMLLGPCYYADANGSGPDVVWDVVSLKNAAYSDNIEAILALGQIFEQGSHGAHRNYQIAFNWYKKAAGLGNAEAMYRCGRLLAKVKNHDYKKAFDWYKKAADMEHAEAIESLGSMYYQGQGVPQDFKEAAVLYKKAADLGNSLAMAGLGIMYYQGQEFSQDFKKAIDWSEKAAALGNITAMYNLGLMYSLNQGIPQNLNKAEAWYKKAADAGDIASISDLGAFYFAAGNRVEAYMWATIAAALGDENGVTNRDYIEKALTTAQIEDGKHLAEAWFKNHPPLLDRARLIPILQ